MVYSHMVFATDNDVGDRIMANLYATAAGRNQDMAQEAREHETGALSLFADSTIKPPKYEATPPLDPAGYLAALTEWPTAVE